MNISLFFIRKIKALFIKLKLHNIVEPFSGALTNLVFLSKLSKWCSQNKHLGFNDFYNNKVKYEDRFQLHEYVFEKENLSQPINFLEFGVAEGTSFKWWVGKNKNENSAFFGFDTFSGLPEDFGVMKKYHYDTKGIFPDVGNDPRCSFYPGMFQDSFPPFLKNFNDDKRKVIHMDADLYSSTIFVLTLFSKYLKKDDIIIFDEFGVPTHEFRAFTDFAHAFQLKYEVLGAVNNYLQLAIKII
jgi:O-methyltransferase